MTDEQEMDYEMTLEEVEFALDHPEYYHWEYDEGGVTRTRPKTSAALRLLDEFGDMINFYESLYELGIDDPSETLFIRGGVEIADIHRVFGPNGYGVEPEQFTWTKVDGGVAVSRNILNADAV
jgi:hypothetical protein